MALVAVLVAGLLLGASVSVRAGRNGQALTPPMGWRSWNQFGADVDQALFEAIAAALADRSRTVGGVPSSLADLGYVNVGLDDAWQEIGAGAPWGHSFHDGAGLPIVNASRFPDMRAMTNAAHALNLTAGWYLNNCLDKEPKLDPSFYTGDVAAWSLYGYDTLKIDGCGPEQDREQWWSLMSATPQGAAAVIETNGGDVGPKQPTNGPLAPPYHFFRTSTDIRPTYGSFVANAQTLRPYMDGNRTGPGTWAFADMSVVGVTNLDLGGCNGPCPPAMTFAEQRAHFSLWCVASQPLTLSLDLRNATVVDAAWPIITNVEAIAINQAWGGAPGGVLAESADNVTLPHCDWPWAGDRNCTMPALQTWWKPLPGSTASVLVMNHGDAPRNVSVDLASVPGLACAAAPGGCTVKDVWTGATANYTGTVPLVGLASHDAAFLWIS
jgi:alpha-galactosidase